MSKPGTDLSLPQEIGTCQERFDGGSEKLVYLVATEAGHPLKAEKAAYDTLEFLHRLHPIDWIFVNFDGSEKSGHVSFDQNEIDLGPYRAYTDRAIAKGIAEMMIGQNILCAALAFGIASEPRARVQALDDWYLRAVQRDALEELNSEGGKIALIESVLTSLLAEGSSSYRDFLELLSCVRLEWTDEEWLKRQSTIEAIDPAVSFSELEAMVPRYENILDHLSFYKKQASRFYEAAIPRIGVLIHESLRVMGRTGARTAALTIPEPWIWTAASLLRKEGVSFISIRPAGILSRAMLELPSLNPADVLEGNKKLEALFSGRHIPGRIEMLEAGQKERRRERSNDWASAGQALALRYEFKKAAECYERALELDPNNAHALWAAGASAVDAHDYRKALTYLKRSARLNPLSAMTWEAMGCALDELGRAKEARKAFLRAIYLEPKNGRYWNRLGLHYHRHGMGPLACYSFKKGSEHKDGMASQNYQTLFRSSDRTASCPLSLRPAVIAVKHKLRAWKRKSRKE